MKSLTLTLFLLFLTPAVAHVPIAIGIQILKAEDARRYDKTLEDLIKHPDLNVRHRAALAAGRIGDEKAVPALAYLLETEAAINTTAMAAFALGEIESIKGVDVLLKALSDPKNPTVVRARAVEAAGKIAAANVKDPKTKELGSAIVNTLESEYAKAARFDRETVLHGLTALLRARPDGSAETAAHFLTSSDARIRADAANTLSRLRAKNANAALRTMLVGDKDAIARANAARALGAAEDKDAFDILLKAATDDTDSRVRVSAFRSLAALKDARAAEALFKRGEVLFDAYKKARKPNFIPNEHNEFLEIATTLGRLLPNTRNARAVDLFREFGKLDKGHSPEVYIARIRIAPGRGDNDKPELTHWRQYSTLAQVVGEFSAIEPIDDEGKKIKAEAPDALRPLAKAFAEADPIAEAKTIMAGPDVLRAFARFKTSGLAEILRTALKNKDAQTRATAAGLLADLPVSQENLDALNAAFDYAIINDTQYDDAVLATIDALFKLDKRKSLSALAVASGSLDHLVRQKVLEMLKDDAFKDADTLPAMLKYADQNHLRNVRPYSGKGTKLGQVLNADADYRRALGRKNGSVKAVLTTEKGTFTIVFNPEEAPLTVDNFIKLARRRYFNGLEVHRVVPNFVMQDGDPRGDGNGGPGWSIRCEVNMLPYDRGAVGMALSGKDTGGSQWFVTHSPQPHLDGGYTVFGHVNESDMKVVDNIVRGDKVLSVKIIENNSPQRTQRSLRKKN